jgi:hypothetical protein
MAVTLGLTKSTVQRIWHAALEVQTGKVVDKPALRHTSAEFIDCKHRTNPVDILHSPARRGVAQVAVAA